MKRNLTKLLSLLLTAALLLSSLSVFSFASEGTSSEDEGSNEGTVVYNRNFEEGWGVYNGFGSEKNMKEFNFFVDYETTVDYGYNYFIRYEAAATDPDGDGDGFTELNFSNVGNPATDKVFVEFDLKADDYINLEGGATSILYGRYAGGATKNSPFTLLGIGANELWLFNQKTTALPLVDEWVHVSIVFDYTDEELVKGSSACRITITADDGENSVSETKEISANTAGYVGLNILRFGYGKDNRPARVGMSFCLDNLRAYCKCTEPMTDEQIAAQGYGVNVNTDAIKTVTILGGENSVNVGEVLANALAMKTGVNYALLHNERESIYDGTYGAPVVYGDEILVPLELLLRYVGFEYYVHEDGKSYDISTGTSATYITMGRDIATVGGEMIHLNMAPAYYTDPETNGKYPVVAMSDVETIFPGHYVTYDDMGLIIVCTIDEVLNREENLDELLGIMTSFIFDFADAETIYEDAQENSGGFTHPYLLGDQDKYDKLIAIWNGTDTTEYDIDLKGTLTNQVNRAYNLYEQFALPSDNVVETPMTDEDGNPIYDEKTGSARMNVEGDHNDFVGLDWNNSYTIALRQPYTDMGGYDVGGRLGDAGTNLNRAYDMAFGYIITGDIKLAQCAYAVMVEVGEWDHWGPGHFLNVSEASTPFAIALDWIYNGIVALENGEIEQDERDYTEYSVEYLEEILYTHGVHMGYIATNKLPCPWPRPARVGSDVYQYSTMTNNWNAVCTSGMWLASLMLLPNEEYKDEAAWLLSANIESLMTYGMEQYAPDGSYVESAGYWGYGTNYMMHGLMGIYYTCGTDYGIMNCWGMDKTFYFACMVESSDYLMFNYHDGSEGARVDSVSFFFASELLDDPAIAQIRKIHINSGKKSCTIRDLLCYPFESEEAEVDVELPLDYYMEGIDGYTTRSSWESGALFAGIIGGDNSVTHGQIDSGDFVYHNGGTVWITDLGTEEYNVYKYFTSPDRYRYYRSNAEGNNVLAITSQPVDVPYGQKTTGFGEVISQGSNEYGSYVTIDNTNVYGGYATTAYRGMLLTNDRKTLVIQDEVALLGAEDMLWSAHFKSSKIKYEIANEGRTLYLYTENAKGVVTAKVRLTLLSNRNTEKFEVTDCYDFRLVGDLGTVSPNYTLAMGGVEEKSRDAYSRITIQASGISFNCAVVIEMLDLDADEEQEVGYKMVNMNTWTPTADNRGEEEDKTTESGKTFRDPAKLKELPGIVKTVSNYQNAGFTFIDRNREYYKQLTNAQFIVNSFEYSELERYQDECELFEEYKAKYDAFAAYIQSNVDTGGSIVEKLCGF